MHKRLLAVVQHCVLEDLRKVDRLYNLQDVQLGVHFFDTLPKHILTERFVDLVPKTRNETCDVKKEEPNERHLILYVFVSGYSPDQVLQIGFRWVARVEIFL